MEETKNIHKELRRLEDVIDSIERKLHHTAGFLELIRSGMNNLFKCDCVGRILVGNQ